MKYLSYAFLSLALATVACSDDNGSAPTVKALELSKTELTVGTRKNIIVTVDYADPDGDIETLKASVDMGGMTQPPQSLALNEAAGKTEGRQQIGFALGVPTAGQLKVAFWLVDAKGNESEQVVRELTVK